MHAFLVFTTRTQAKQLAQAVLDTCDVPGVRASAATTLGRALHAQGALGEALKQYIAAQRMQPTGQLPRYGHAQLLVLRRDFANAAALLQVLLKEDPGWLDPLKLLWGLSSKAGAATLEAALPHFQAACRKGPSNPQLKEMLGDVQVAASPATALQCYEQAARLYTKHRGRSPEVHGTPAVNGVEAVNGEDEVIEVDACPPRLLNNMAVLLLQAGDSQRARELMTAAMAVRLSSALVFCRIPSPQLQASAMDAANQAGTPDPHAALLQMTLAFNEARVLEASGEWHAAEQRYKEAAGSYPDCMLRLALLAKRRGDLQGALEWADKAQALADLQTDAHCIKGACCVVPCGARVRSIAAACVYMDMGRPDMASEWFKKVDAAAARAPSSAMDTYARVSLANLHLHATSIDRVVRKVGLTAAVVYACGSAVTHTLSLMAARAWPRTRSIASSVPFSATARCCPRSWATPLPRTASAVCWQRAATWRRPSPSSSWCRRQPQPLLALCR